MNETQQAPIRLTTPMIVLPDAKTIMERHGCRVGVGTVSLPIGSTRTQRLEIVTLTVWYDIVLPDGYQLLEAYDHQRQLSILYLQPDDVMTMGGGISIDEQIDQPAILRLCEQYGLKLPIWPSNK